MSDHISEDLVVEIFTRLPPKPLIRFRSVSKSLCSRIATPDFIRLNMSRMPEKVLLTHEIPHEDRCRILYENFYTLHSEDQLPLSPDHGYDGITPIKFPFPLRSRARVVGSCNGIMCVLIHDERDFILWNPSIRRKLTLPEYPLRRRAIFATGFAFDRVTDDYKIVMLSFDENDRAYSFVYSMKTDDRRSANILHYILTFDVGTNVFGTIQLPIQKDSKITTIDGSLAVITISLTDEDRYAKIWVRKGNNASPEWVAYYSVRLNSRASILMPLSRKGILLLKYLPNGIDVYNNWTRERSRLMEFSDSSNIKDMSWFVESLELLDTRSPYEESSASNDLKTAEL